MPDQTVELERDPAENHAVAGDLRAELAAHRRLHDISCRLIPAHDVGTLYAELTDAAIEIMQADCGTMQSIEAQTGELCLLEARGLPRPAVEKFARVRPDARTSCAEALRRGERVLVDYLADDRFAGSDDGQAHLDVGIRTALSTPLLARSGQLVGMLTTHWNGHFQPPEWQLRMLDILARQAADLVERHHSDEAMRRSEERYRELFTSMTEGFCIIEKVDTAPGEPLDFRYIEANPAFERQSGLGGVVGKTVREVVPREPQEWFDTFDRVARTGEDIRFERELVTQGRVLELYAFRVGDGRSRQVGVVFRDVTDRKRAEKALRESEKRFRTLADTAPAMIWVLDTDSRCTFLSRGWYAYTGQAPGEGLGSGWLDAVHPEDRDRARRTILEAAREQEPCSCDYRLLHASGEYRWALDEGRPRFDQDGLWLGYVGSVIDIHDRKVVEEALRRSEERLRLATAAAQLGLHDFDVRAGTVEWDRRTRELWGVGDDVPITYEVWRQSLHPDDLEEAEAAVQHALDPNRDGRYVAEYRITDRKTGAQRWILALGQTLFVDGQPVRLLGTTQDVTDRKRADRALRESEERYRSLFESIDEGFAVLDMIFDGDRPVDYRFVETNPAFERQTGLTNAVDRTAREMIPQLEEHWFETYGRIARTGQPERFVNHARDMDSRWFDVYAFRLGGEGSTKVALLFKDITEQTRTMQELEELNRTLEQRVEERTREVQELASTLSMAEHEERRRIARVLHDDLQQLLFGVHLRLEYLARDVAAIPDEKLKKEFDETRDWVGEAIGTTRELAVDLNPPVLKSEGLPEALRWLASQMHEKHGLQVSLDVDTDLDLPDEDLRSLFFQTVRELLFNVVKHAGVQEAIVSLERIDGFVRLVVSDEGAGFDLETATQSTRTGGGLGLFSARERLRLVGGRLEVDAAPGRGTRITVSAPTTLS